MKRQRRAHYLQHVPFEGLGSIEPWLNTFGYEITRTQLFKAESLPDIDEIDLLIVLGGPMGVHDQDVFPWLVQEKLFIRSFIETGKPVLGICLGAQLIASVMGARVYQNHEKEIGWFSVQGVTSVDESSFRFPESIEAFHWHGETFNLPPGAVHLARSECCENQAFQLGPAVIGLQFHLETTADSARQLVNHCRAELISSSFVQSETFICAAAPETYRAINEVMAEILSFLTRSRG